MNNLESLLKEFAEYLSGLDSASIKDLCETGYNGYKLDKYRVIEEFGLFLDNQGSNITLGDRVPNKPHDFNITRLSIVDASEPIGVLYVTSAIYGGGLSIGVEEVGSIELKLRNSNWGDTNKMRISPEQWVPWSKNEALEESAEQFVHDNAIYYNDAFMSFVDNYIDDISPEEASDSELAQKILDDWLFEMDNSDDAVRDAEEHNYLGYIQLLLSDLAKEPVIEALEEPLEEDKNETLNPALWDGDELKPEVKEKLQFIAHKFINKLEEDNIPLDVDDIIIVGSNVNYNYGPKSDIDLHIVADMSQFKGREEELAEKIYQCKKSIFNDKYDPIINGVEVEIYVEPSDDKDNDEVPDEVEAQLDEDFLGEAKQDKENFINKFGEDTYNNFVRAKDRLKNNGISTDIVWHTKNTSVEGMNKLIQSLYQKDTDQQRLRQVKGEDKNIRGKYEYLGEVGGYKIYHPMDVESSMDLGVNSGWCITGRYGHYGHPEFTPSREKAEGHWNDYTSQGITFYYLLDPKTMYAKWAVALYRNKHGREINALVNRTYIRDTNCEIYNDEDSLMYSAFTEIRDILGSVGVEIYYTGGKIIDGGLIVSDDGKTLFGTASEEDLRQSERRAMPVGRWSSFDRIDTLVIPDGIEHIDTIFKYVQIRKLVLPGSIKIVYGWFAESDSLQFVEFKEGVREISAGAFVGCEGLKFVVVPDSVTKIGRGAFFGCPLEEIRLPDRFKDQRTLSFIGVKPSAVISSDDYKGTNLGVFLGERYNYDDDHVEYPTDEEEDPEELEYQNNWSPAGGDVDAVLNDLHRWYGENNVFVTDPTDEEDGMIEVIDEFSGDPIAEYTFDNSGVVKESLNIHKKNLISIL